jgi:hypothetical protein
MDPYLEGELWQEFHQTLATEIRAQIVRVLPKNYVALLSKHYVLDFSGIELVDVPPARREFYPDVHVVQTAPAGTPSSPSTLELTPPTMEVDTPPISVPQLRVEIRDVAQRHLVTVIEILSRANKIGAGARQYVEKREDLLATDVHLLEIDLLRAGSRLPLSGLTTNGDYYVYLNRATRRWRTSVWAMALPVRLPIVPVPLLDPDPDVRLDLQAALDASFALVGYDRLIDYTAAPPEPALSDAGLRWVHNILLSAGRRAAESG